MNNLGRDEEHPRDEQLWKDEHSEEMNSDSKLWRDEHLEFAPFQMSR